MILKLTGMIIGMVVLFPCASMAGDVALDLVMPGTMFGPGSPFYLDLIVINSGDALPGSQVYVALSIGTGDFWFFPRWLKFPPDVDWQDMDIAALSEETLPIIPQFSWPDNAGEFSGAMFFAAILNNGALASNLADITFGWSEAPQPTPTTSPGIVSVGNMIPVSAGTFTQGSDMYTESCREVNETQFAHTLTRNLAVMETEITRQMWADLKAVQPSLPIDMSDWSLMHIPAQNNTWFEAVLFANLLSIQNGYQRCYYSDSGYTQPIDVTNYTSGPFFCNFTADGYRLPSEGEWEYFARAGTTGPFSCEEPNYSLHCQECGPGILPTLELYCVFCANNPGLCAVAGSKAANPWGLKDVHGNVFEWCWDWYDAYPAAAQIDYTGAASGTARVERGGSWHSPPHDIRSALRNPTNPANRTHSIGFRLVRTIE